MSQAAIGSPIVGCALPSGSSVSLDELYAFYEGTEAMWTNIFRDEPLVAAVGPNLARFRGYLGAAARLLAEGWADLSSAMVRRAAGAG